jgi:phospholipid/cholesterol/gamma-HCH transport system substrate-binding protein
MPEAQDLRWWRTTPGLIAIGSAVILTVVLAVFTSVSGAGFRRHKLTVTTYFNNSAGLKSGAAVNLAGVTIGTVKNVTITSAPERRKAPVQVVMKIDGKFQSELHTDSTATIVSLGAMGDTEIDISSRDAFGPQLRDGDNLKSIVSPSVLDAHAVQETINSMNAMVDRLNTVVDQIETGKGSIGQFMSNPGLTNEATATVAKVRDVTARLNGTSNSAGKLLNDHSLPDKFGRIATDVQGVGASLAKLTGGPLQANLAATEAHVNSLAADVNSGNGSVHMLMTDSPVKRDLSGAAAQAKVLGAGLSAGKGSAGKLVAGGELKVDLTKFQAETAALATMIRQNPTKYLTIEVRVF